MIIKESQLLNRTKFVPRSQTRGVRSNQSPPGCPPTEAPRAPRQKETVPLLVLAIATIISNT